MPPISRRAALSLGLALVLSACGGRGDRNLVAGGGGLHPGETPELRSLIVRYAREYDVPVSLVHRVVQRESGYNPRARNGQYMGLMQIAPQTARTMGFRGHPSDLLDAETNLRYAVKYLRGAWMVSNGSHDRAVMWYSKGYYYEAKRRGLLAATGLRS
ncbi:lytic transglycosylase domain-containing protein [Pseudotabrizicola alkalilacus]|uniref:Lytic transglycosylase domain-containing protein n=1 Tax=Pseudotabrizicola alkalilacus TaxID=2305252 RepID=A0A411Z3P1_9RHOB|nr:lytic transglycosylase domain-containing protein [Pseudotabrizicola alkalilacus]RGP37687.1 lytic transglycosylase domain-containing protein [Pseudotabrizicola alkalilacus]